MTKRIFTFACLLLGLMLSGDGKAQTQSSNPSNTTTMEKKLIGNTLALYPMPLTVVGAEVDGRVNWLVVAHVGIIGHDRILVSMSQSHYTNRGIRASRKLSVNLVSRGMLPAADRVGGVSGARTDKSQAFAWHRGANGAPVIDRSPLTMACDVVDIYETEGFADGSLHVGQRQRGTKPEPAGVSLFQFGRGLIHTADAAGRLIRIAIVGLRGRHRQHGRSDTRTIHEVDVPCGIPRRQRETLFELRAVRLQHLEILRKDDVGMEIDRLPVKGRRPERHARKQQSEQLLSHVACVLMLLPACSELLQPSRNTGRHAAQRAGGE